MNPKLLSLHGLKWNPFSPDLPAEALLVTPKLEHFGWRVEHLAREGGFALITGEPGLGKSVALRLLAERLSAHRDLVLGILTRPQSGIPDFYRDSAICSASSSRPTIAGPARACCANAGRITSPPPCCGRC